MNLPIKHKIFAQKFIFAVIILIIYMVGKSIPLYGIDVSAYKEVDLDAQNILLQIVCGDNMQISVFALGISPYIMGNMMVQMILSCHSREAKKRISPRKTGMQIMFLMLAFAIVQAILRVDSLRFVTAGNMLIITKLIAIIQMITGAYIVLWMSQGNKKYGIGGQTLLIFINILDGMRINIFNHQIDELKLPLIICFFVVFIMIILEMSEMRIPMQRVSIHNIYADKNYTAIKLNPVGAMPVMYASVFFMLPQMAIGLLHKFFPESEILVWLKQNIVLTELPGIIVYISIFYILTILFSMIFLNPKDMAENLLKSGDSIVGIPAGEVTRKYLVKTVVGFSVFSATIMSIFLGGPMFIQLTGMVDRSLVMLPSSAMFLAGMWYSLYLEIEAIRNYDEYQPFI